MQDDFIRLREEISQPEEGSFQPFLVDDNKIFVKKVGGLKKLRLYGMTLKYQHTATLPLLVAFHLRQVIAMS